MMRIRMPYVVTVKGSHGARRYVYATKRRAEQTISRLLARGVPIRDIKLNTFNHVQLPFFGWVSVDEPIPYNLPGAND